MKQFYIICADDENLHEISSKFALFKPISNDKTAVFSAQDALNLALNNKEDEILSQIILKFDEFCAQSKQNVAVISNPNFDFLDINIAKNLNLPVIFLGNYDNKNKILANIAEKNGLNAFCIDSVDEIFALKFEPTKITTALKFKTNLTKIAQQNKANIVLPESEDERILRACNEILSKDIANIILLGNASKIHSDAKNLGLNLNNATIIDVENNQFLDDFANKLYEIRKEKGLNLDEARNLVKDRIYFATMLVFTGIADAMVSGANTTTAQTIRPALQIIKTKPEISVVSGLFFICLDKEILAFADCAITPNPSEKQLAEIAVCSAKSVREFGLEPKVAMLSYSTLQSGDGKDVEFMRTATQIAKQTLAQNVDGPLQFDAAIDKIVAQKKAPNSSVAGEANVFIFPDLNCANICYKAVQRTANAVAIGPILQGLKKPVNDLSRGANVQDIVQTIIITAIQAKGCK